MRTVIAPSVWIYFACKFLFAKTAGLSMREKLHLAEGRRRSGPWKTYIDGVRNVSRGPTVPAPSPSPR